MENANGSTTDPVRDGKSWFRVIDPSIVSLMDQGVVSATRFLTSVAIGRFAGADELGVYALIFTIVVLLFCVQESLITLPYTIYSRRKNRQKSLARYASSVFVHQLVVIVECMLVFLCASMVIGIFAPDSALPVMFVVLACVTPAVLLKEFARRMAFAHLRFNVALLIDVTMSITQLAAILLLILAERLTAATAFWVFGLACALPAIVLMWQAQGRFVWNRTRVRLDWRRNWLLGRWAFFNQLIAVISGFGMLWVVGAILNANAVGIYAACLQLILLGNPLLLGAGNFIAPKLSHSFVEQGAKRVSELVWKYSLTLTSISFLLVTFLFVMADPILNFLYGPEFVGNRLVIGLLGLGFIEWSLTAAFVHGLNVLERPDINVKASAMGLIVTLVLCVPFVMTWGIVGAAMTPLIGCIPGCIYQIWAFRRLTRSTK